MDANGWMEFPCMAKVKVYVKELRGDTAVVFVQSEHKGLHHYPFTVPLSELSDLTPFPPPPAQEGK